MVEISSFIERCERYSAATGKSLGAVSKMLFGASDRIDEIRGGSDIGVRRLGRADRDLRNLEAALCAEAA